MSQQACQERATGRIGLCVGESPGGLDVVFSPAAPIETVKGNAVIRTDLPSLTFIRMSDPDLLHKLIAEDMPSVLKMIIGGMESFDATAVKIKKKFESQTQVTGIDITKHLGNALKTGDLVSQSEGGNKVYSVAGEFSPIVPEQCKWMIGYEAKEKSAPKEKLKTVALTPAEIFIQRISIGGVEGEGEYVEWLADPVAASLDLTKQLNSHDGQIKLKKIGPQEINVFCLCPSKFWLESSAEETRLLNKHLVSILGSHSTSILQLMDSASSSKESAVVVESLQARISSLQNPAIETRTPFDLFKALFAIRRLTDGEPAVAISILKKILTDKSIEKSLREKRRVTESDDVDGIISRVISSTPWGEAREALTARAITFWRMKPESLDVFGGASMTNMIRLLESLDENNLSDRDLLTQAAARLEQLLEFKAGVESAALVFGLVTKYKLELSPKKVANYMAGALAKDERLKSLSKTLSGEFAVSEFSADLAELRNVKVRLEASALDAAHKISEQSRELEALRSKLVADRKETESDLGQSDAQSKLPVLKLLARTLSAAEEFLVDNPGALARFEILAEQASLLRLGHPGDEVAFDPLVHMDPEGQLEPGQMARVYVVGYAWKDAGAELVLQKALVHK